MNAQMNNLRLYSNGTRIKRALRVLLIVGGLVAIAGITCWSQQLAYSSPSGGETKEPRAVTRRPASPTGDASKASASSLAAEHDKLRKRRDYLSRYLLTVDPASKDYEVTQLAIRELDVKLHSFAREARGEPARSAQASVVGRALINTAALKVDDTVADLSAAASPQATCTDPYTDAPPAIKNLAAAAASDIVDGGRDPGQIDAFLPRLMIFTIADALSVTDAERAALNQLQITRARAETKRTDKQVGASADSEGSTSAAEKPGFVQLLGFAVEHGAIQQEVNGTTLTLSSSPYALVIASKGQDADTAAAYNEYGFLDRIGVSANFNIDDQNDVLSNARRSRLSEWSVRARLTKDRSTRSKEFFEFWDQKIRPIIVQKALILTKELSDTFQGDTNVVRVDVKELFFKRAAAGGQPTGFIQDFLRKNAGMTDDALKTALTQEILCRLKTVIHDKLDAFPLSDDTKRRIVSITIPRLIAAEEAEAEVNKLVDEQIKKMENRPMATLAYTNKRQEAMSGYSQLKFLYEKNMASPMKVVGNLGFSLYHDPDRAINQQTIRDITAALSFEGRLGRSPMMLAEDDQSQMTFSFTGRYERMFENRNIAGRKADIAVAQFKLEIPIFTGMSLPFSVTYANATELIKEDHVRANFGFTFDTDKLLQIIRLANMRQ